MNVLKPRTRMISVRLSQDEFDQLRQIAVAIGARSTSDLARQALNEFVERAKNPSPKNGVWERLAALESEVNRLSRILDRLVSTAREQDS